jgi:hypothetical protein
VLPPRTGAGHGSRSPRADNANRAAAERVRTTTRDGTLARGTSARSTEVNSAGLFRFQDRRAVGPRHQGSANLRGGSRARTQAFGRHPTGRGVLLGEKCATPPAREPPTRAPRENRQAGSGGLPNEGGRPADGTLNLPVRPLGLHPFTPERFHVLLNSLFKVLFNFPSRYLFAIGLVVVFSLRWSLPPA